MQVNISSKEFEISFFLLSKKTDFEMFSFKVVLNLGYCGKVDSEIYESQIITLMKALCFFCLFQDLVCLSGIGNPFQRLTQSSQL